MPMGAMGAGGGMPAMSSGLTREQAWEISLARTAKNLLIQYGREQRPEVKEKLKSDLRAILHQQFRLQHQRRDAELARVERRLADLRTRLKKRGDAQSTIVDRRLEQLVNDVDGLGWSAEELPDNLFNDGGLGMMLPGMGMGMGRPGMMGSGGMPPPAVGGTLDGGSGIVGGAGVLDNPAGAADVAPAPAVSPAGVTPIEPGGADLAPPGAAGLPASPGTGTPGQPGPNGPESAGAPSTSDALPMPIVPATVPK